MSNLTPVHIRRMLREQKIAGVKVDRDWFTTRAVIRAYLETDRRPGPKTD